LLIAFQLFPPSQEGHATHNLDHSGICKRNVPIEEQKVRTTNEERKLNHFCVYWNDDKICTTGD